MTAKTSTRTRKPTAKQAAAAEAKAAERAALTASLKAAEESFEYDEDDAKMVRAFESLTTHYSEGNALLILAQAAQQGRRVRGLQDVGGFGVWVERGRSVKKGEHKSIFIWARGAKTVDDKNATAPAPEAMPTATTDGEARSFYFVVGIFHVSQTEDKAKADVRRAAEQAK
jgi:hypothetical protein